MSAVSGSLFRRIFFWSHLTAGLAAGVFVFIMSVTGVLLAYERQMLKAAERGNHVSAPAGAAVLPAQHLADAARAATPDAPPTSLIFVNEPGAPVIASRGRAANVLLNPYTAAVLPDAASGMRDFFRVTEDWHRRMGGQGSSMRAWLIDYGNLIFLFIVLSGIYIWLPSLWRWPALRFHMLFQKQYVNSKVRDFNWHHVLAFWMLIPLFLISFSGVVMSFPWANEFVFAAYGEEAPQRRGPPGLDAAQAGNRGAARGEAGERASLGALHAVTIEQIPLWQRMTLPLAARGPQVDVVVELKSDQARAPRQTVTFNSADATISPVQGVATQSPGQRARTWLRFVHTGEQYGIVGQTLAALASLAACLLAYTGWALAYRRLLKPLFRRRASPVAFTAVRQD